MGCELNYRARTVGLVLQEDSETPGEPGIVARSSIIFSSSRHEFGHSLYNTSHCKTEQYTKILLPYKPFRSAHHVDTLF